MKSSAPLFRLDLSRGLFLGILESSFGVFVLLICIRYFDAPDYCKGLIAAGGSIGLLATSLLVAMWSNSRASEPMKCAIYMLLSGVFILISSWVSGVLAFAFLMLMAQVFLSQVPSLMIGVYSSLYSKRDRGFRVSCALVASTIGGIVTSLLFGKYMDTPESDYRLILWCMSFPLFSARPFIFSCLRSIEPEKRSVYSIISEVYGAFPRKMHYSEKFSSLG